MSKLTLSALILLVVFTFGFGLRSQASPADQCGQWQQLCPGIDFGINVTFEAVPTEYNGSIYFGGDGPPYLWRYDEVVGTCEMVAGDGRNGSWSMPSAYGVDALLVYQGKLWITVEGRAIGIYSYDGTSFTLETIPGEATDRETEHHSLVEHNGDLYLMVDESQVWRRDATTGVWNQDAGGGLNGSWTDSSFAIAPPSLSYNGALYFLDDIRFRPVAELWRRDATGWQKLAGRFDGDPWPASSPSPCIFGETYGGLAIYDGHLVVATLTNDDPAIWWTTDPTDPLAWEKIGGDNVRCSWGTADYCYINLGTTVGGHLIATLSRFTASYPRSDPWQFNGTHWAKLEDAQSIWGEAVVWSDRACGETSGSGYFMVRHYPSSRSELWQYTPDNTLVPEVTGVRMVKQNPLDPTASAVHVSWDSLPVTGCDSYQVVGGYLGDLWGDHGFNRAVCRSAVLPVAVLDDTPDSSQWYLVRVVTDCGKGTYGSSFYPAPTAGQPDYRDFLDDPPTDPCP